MYINFIIKDCHVLVAKSQIITMKSLILSFENIMNLISSFFSSSCFVNIMVTKVMNAFNMKYTYMFI